MAFYYDFYSIYIHTVLSCLLTIDSLENSNQSMSQSGINAVFFFFFQRCNMNILCQRREIPGFLLHISLRITKYPILIESILKTTKGKSFWYLSLNSVSGVQKYDHFAQTVVHQNYCHCT